MASGLFTLKQVNQAIDQNVWSGYMLPQWVEYLCVAGGGGGGVAGGGAGGLLTGIVSVVPNTSYTVTVGAGGVGRGASYPTTAIGTNGSNSVFGSITTVGGGLGGFGDDNNSAGSNGGSGGGAAFNAIPGRGTLNQGNDGGTTYDSGANTQGGGGGAGTAGLPNIKPAVRGSGNGGAGVVSSITGNLVAYAGGGGGGSYATGSTAFSRGGEGGTGGGGTGGSSATPISTGGIANTGGGGGGSSAPGGAGAALCAAGAGGSGIVVVRYPGNVQYYTGGAVTYAGGHVVHTFYASGTLAPTTPTVITTDYQIQRSLRFNSADSAYLNRTPASAGNQKTWTWSGWVKRSTLGTLQTLFASYSANTDASAFAIILGSGNTISVVPWTNAIFTSTAVFRDTSAWYHIVVAFDSTQSNANDRVIVYVNEVRQAGTYPIAVTQNTNYAVNAVQAHRLGDWPAGGFSTFGGYMTEVNFVDGQALTPQSFGSTNANTGVWQPKAYTGTYGTNGFYLNFSDNSNTTSNALGKDYSGNSNNWTPNNFSVTAGIDDDSMVDVPTSYGVDTGVGGTVRGNYCTWNPLSFLAYGNGVDYKTTLSNGNLTATCGPNFSWALGTLEAPAGVNTYIEYTINSYTSATNGWIGFTGDFYFAFGCTVGGAVTIGSYTATDSPGFVTGDVIGFAFNRSTNSITMFKNGSQVYSLRGLVGYGLTPDKVSFPAVWLRSSGDRITLNAGQRPFAYTAPAGAKSLCTHNFPAPTIGSSATTLANKYFNVITYTGDSTNPRNITGVGFQPDLVWLTRRNQANNHFIHDAVRGVLPTNSRTLVPNTMEAETNYYPSNGMLTAFISDGFTTSGGGSNLNANGTGNSYVAWNWKASNAAPVTNTSGSVTSQVSANLTSGFSIVTYTGNTSNNITVGHGLGRTPSFIIVKDRVNSSNWPTYHSALGVNSGVSLNDNTGNWNITNYWSVSPTTFGAISGGYYNNYGGNTVAYCFAEVPGYSKFGSYSGNANADGPFVYCGFRPRYILIRWIGAESWFIFDTARGPYNPNMPFMQVNQYTTVEYAFDTPDILSNGFKLTTNNGSINGNGYTMIYAAFAETPFKYSLAR